MLFHPALADKIKFKPHALNTRLYLSRVWSLTFTTARCRALCRVPPAFRAGSRRSTRGTPEVARGPGKEGAEEVFLAGEGWGGLEGLGDERAARRSGTSRRHTWVTAACAGAGSWAQMW